MAGTQAGHPMSKSADGTWRVTLTLPTGSYEYKFVVDGRWVCEPGVDEFDPKLIGSPDCFPNVFGSMNRRLDV
jgi:Glycogen recognition site of AMP-activated protein kinase